MKPLILIPIFLLSACATRAPQKAPAIPQPSLGRKVNATGLRTEEQLREYRFGRYVDPGDPLAMHEAHPLYRVESSAEWNLRAGSRSPLPRPNIVPASSVMTNDAVIAEVNKQRAATRAVTEQTATLNERLGEMTKAAAQTQELLKQTLALKQDVATLRDHIDSIDSEVRARKTSPDRPPVRAEDKW